MLATAQPTTPAAGSAPDRDRDRWAPIFADLDAAFAGVGPTVVTLTGAPGVGKSTVARAWLGARGLESARVALTSASDEVDLARCLFVALRGGGVAPLLPSSPAELLLGVRGTIVVLDDADRVVEPLAGLIRAVLGSRCERGVRLLVTSREPLRLHGERVIPVVRPSHVAAVELFLAACRAAGAKLRGTAEELESARAIVTLLDRVPLALEMAASHTRVVPLAALQRSLDEGTWVPRAGLRGGSPHHVSLDDAVSWSVGTLGAPERALLDELCVFEGGFDLAAFTAIAGQGREDELAALVQRSLVRRFRIDVGERFDVPRPVREVVSRDGGPSPTTCELHTEWYRRLGRQLASGGRSERDRDRLLADYHNVAVARRRNCQRCAVVGICECAASAEARVDTAVLACPRVSPGGSCDARAAEGPGPSCMAGGGVDSSCPVVLRVSRLAATLEATSGREWCRPAREAPPSGEGLPPRLLGSRDAEREVGERQAPLRTTPSEHLRPLEVAPGGSFFRAPDGSEVDLRARPTLARLLEQLVEARLAEPGAPVAAATLLERIWGRKPGKHRRANVGRLYIAIARLRAMGLEQHLLNVGGGYLLNGAAPVVWSTSAAPATPGGAPWTSPGRAAPAAEGQRT